MQATLSGYWRDPRIFQFGVTPMVSFGEPVAGAEMGNAVTGFSGVGICLQGSSFPLTVSYSRTGNSLEGEQSVTGNSNQVLSGVETSATSTAFDANWTLRFRYWPTVHLDYQATDYDAPLPKPFTSGDDHRLNVFSGKIDYRLWGWQAGGWYQRNQSDSTYPDIVDGTVQNSSSRTTDMGSYVTGILPLQSVFSGSLSRSDLSSNFDDTTTSNAVDVANATITSQPWQRLTTTMSEQYISNLQAYQVQQTLAGTGVAGSGTTTGTTATLTTLSAPFSIQTVSWTGAYRVGYGFGINGGTSETSFSSEGSSTQWSIGTGYQHKFKSGWFNATYSHNNTDTQTEVISENSTVAVPFSQSVATNMLGVSLTHTLPFRLKLMTTTHVTEGTIYDNGIPYPDRDYGGLATLTRNVGEWRVNGTLTFEKTEANQALIDNQNTSKGASVAVSYRNLNLSASRQYGDGYAVQLGSNLVPISGPTAVSSVLGTPLLTNSVETAFTGSYRSRSGRFMVTGGWWHFNYATEDQPSTESTLYHVRASYKLRRLRLLAGYVVQSQTFNSIGVFNSRLVYFQIERVFRAF
jgi:hypothetical protein